MTLKRKPDCAAELKTLAEHLALCLAEIDRWETMAQASADVLAYAMEAVDIQTVDTDTMKFTVTEKGIDVEQETVH